MRKMQKIATLVVTAAMGLTLAACSSSSTTTTTVSTSDGEKTSTSTATTSSSTGKSGESDTYTNEVLKVAYAVPAGTNLEFKDRDALAAENGTTYSEGYLEGLLGQGKTVTVMFATNDSGDVVRLYAADAAATGNTDKTAKEFVNVIIPQLDGVEGLKLESSSATDFTVNGTTYPGITVTYDKGGAKVYARIACVKSDSHFSWLTVSSADANEADTLLGGLSTL